MRYYLLFLPLLFPALLSAQTATDEQIFTTMKEELGRSMQLTLPEAPKPFLGTYKYVVQNSLQISASLGTVMVSETNPQRAYGGASILVGNHEFSSEVDFSGTMRAAPMPLDHDAYGMKLNYWLLSDIAYRTAAMNYSTKKVKDTEYPESERSLGDLIPLKPVTYIEESLSLDVDRKQWEEKLRELSLLFMEYKDLFSSQVSLQGQAVDYYMLSTEGVQLKKSYRTISLEASAQGMNELGHRIADKYMVKVARLEDLPSMEEIQKNIVKMVERLRQRRDAEMFDGYYYGPVLFLDGGSSSLFSKFTWDSFQPTKRFDPFSSMDGNIPDVKYTDYRLSAINYSNMTEYKGKPVKGGCKIDIEGVTPPDQVVLLENGILRNKINNRYEHLMCKQSTGSARFRMAAAGAGPLITGYVDFAVLHYQVKKGKSPAKLKQELIENAKRDGHPYAFIVRGGGVDMVYKVDLKTGKETMMKAKVSPKLLSEIRFIDFSNKEMVLDEMPLMDYHTLIVPSGALVEFCEVTGDDDITARKPSLPFPLSEPETK